MKNSEKIEVIKKKKWKIPKGQVYYSNSDSVTITGELEVAGTFIVGYQDNSDDMKTAREVIGTQPVRHHHSEKRSKRSPTLIDQIILYSFDRIKKQTLIFFLVLHKLYGRKSRICQIMMTIKEKIPDIHIASPKSMMNSLNIIPTLDNRM